MSDVHEVMEALDAVRFEEDRFAMPCPAPSERWLFVNEKALRQAYGRLALGGSAWQALYVAMDYGGEYAPMGWEPPA